MSLSDLTVPDLQKLAATSGVALTSGMKKADIVSALEAAGVKLPDPAPQTDAETTEATHAESEEDPAGSRFHVHLLATTPLGKNPLVLSAKDEADARAKFNEANGISGSKQTYRIRTATAADEAEQAERDKPKTEPTPAPAPPPST